ncbi:MAG: hypothetical protein WBA57_14315 [Elainellaceae cyanobacterium]
MVDYLARSIPMAELRRLEQQLSGNSQALEALMLLQQHHGNLTQAINELAEGLGVQGRDLMNNADKAGRQIAQRITNATTDELSGIAGTTACYVANLIDPNHPEVSMITGFVIAIAVKAMQSQQSPDYSV